MNETEKVAARLVESSVGEGSYSLPPVSEPRRGRPKGSKNRPKEPEPQGLMQFVYVEDEVSIAASTAMGAVVWSIISPMFKMRDLHDEERIKLGRALDPVLCRWIP